MVARRFPYGPVDLVTDFYIDGQYRTVVEDDGLRDTQVISVTEGRANEQAQFAPTSSTFLLGDKTRKYAPRNPTGPYFGKFGRNTPCRQAIRTDSDAFARTVSNGWGTSDGGFAWAIENSTSSQHAVNGSSATHSITSTNSFVVSYLSGGVALPRVRTAVTFSLQSITSVTGGSLEPATMIVRKLSSTDYYYARVTITTAGAVQLSIKHYDETSIIAPQTILTGWAGERLRVAVLAEAHAMLAKVWRVDSEPEPYGWHIQGLVKTDTLPGAGTVGIRSGVASGNSNSKPIVFVYDDWEVTSPLAFTEVAKWPTRQNKSNVDKTVPIEAKGITRRLGQGKSPLRSTLYRAIVRQGTAVAYWPCEDGKDSTAIASGLADGIPMRVVGTPRYASYSDIPATAPIPELAQSYWFGSVAPYTATGDIYVSMLIHVPDGGSVDQDPIFQVRCNGSAHYWNLRYWVDGSLSLEAYNINIVNLLSTGPIGFNINGRKLRLALSLSENGSGGVDWQIAVLDVGQTTGGIFGGTLASATVGAATDILTNTLGHMDQVALGQIAIYPEILSLFALYQELNAYTGEPAGFRIQRLLEENGIAFIPYGDPDPTDPMGPQGQDTLLNLLLEAELVDGGFLFEPAGILGIGFRTRDTLYNQTPALTTAYESLTDSWEPVEDDQLVRNDITVTRKNGSSVRVTQTDGPMSILDPQDGGVGRYDTQTTVNCELDDQLIYIASWLLHLGTVDEPRYPKLTMDLAAKGFATSLARYQQVLCLSQGDRILVTDPPDGQAPDDISQMMRGMTRQISRWGFRVDVNTVPETPWQVFKLNTSRLAPTTSDLTDNETDSDTSVRLDTSGPVWTTDPTQMPIPLRVSGEVMQATAITGSTSPQTATMTRAVNDVHKAQDAGTTVELRDPPVLAHGRRQ